jgi:hypothetical protein
MTQRASIPSRFTHRGRCSSGTCFAAGAAVPFSTLIARASAPPAARVRVRPGASAPHHDRRELALELRTLVAQLERTGVARIGSNEQADVTVAGRV